MARRSFGGYGKNRPCSTLRRAATSPEEEEAAVLALQAAARGLLARRAVRAVRDAEREVEEVLAPRVAAVLMREAAKASGGGGGGGDDARAKLAVAEELMRLLLRLDAVRGARAYRRRVVARVLALQDAVDAGGAA